MNPPAQPHLLSAQTLLKRPALALLIALAAIALLLTACGDEEPGLPPAGDSSAAGSAPQVSTAPSQPTAAPAAPAAPTAQSSSASAAPATPATSDPMHADPVKVVTGNSVLSDLVQQVGGDLVQGARAGQTGLRRPHLAEHPPLTACSSRRRNSWSVTGPTSRDTSKNCSTTPPPPTPFELSHRKGWSLRSWLKCPSRVGTAMATPWSTETNTGAELAGRLLIGDGETGALSRDRSGDRPRPPG